MKPETPKPETPKPKAPKPKNSQFNGVQPKDAQSPVSQPAADPSAASNDSTLPREGSRTPLLTVGIPTYNGSKYIKTCLDSVLAQTEGLSQKFYAGIIEILILDNGSTDKTAEIVVDYQGNFGDLIVSVRNPVNIGYDKNIDAIFKNAKGKFVKILADDDALMPSFIATQLATISEHPGLGVLLSNFDIYDEDLVKLLTPFTMPAAASALYRDPDDFLKNSGGRYGQVSSLTIERELWNSCDPSQGLGCNYIHIYMLLRLLAKSDCNYIYSEPQVKVRTGSPNFEKLASDYILVPLKLVSIYKNCGSYGLKQKTMATLLTSQRHYVFRRLIGARIQGLNNRWQVFMSCLKTNYDFLPFWLYYIHLFYLPRFSILWLKRIAKENR